MGSDIITFMAVDQNRERLTELTRLLEAFPGSVIYQHTNPLQAPKDVRNNRVDDVFLQLDLESLGGAELTRILRSERANLPVFLLTDAERNGRTAPKDHTTVCLARPISAELLRESLSGVLRDGVPGLRKACVWGAFSISSG